SQTSAHCCNTTASSAATFVRLRESLSLMPRTINASTTLSLTLIRSTCSPSRCRWRYVRWRSVARVRLASALHAVDELLRVSSVVFLFSFDLSAPLEFLFPCRIVDRDHPAFPFPLLLGCFESGGVTFEKWRNNRLRCFAPFPVPLNFIFVKLGDEFLD